MQIEKIKAAHQTFLQLQKKRKSILNKLSDQGVLNQNLEKKLLATKNLQTLEDLYLPYQQKRKTRATEALEKGLKPLAIALHQQKHKNKLDSHKKSTKKTKIN